MTVSVFYPCKLTKYFRKKQKNQSVNDRKDTMCLSLTD